MRASGLALFLLCAARPASRLDDAVLSIPGFGAPHASGPCGDGESLRRLSLDLLGYPPNGTETAAFIADSAPDRDRGYLGVEDACGTLLNTAEFRRRHSP